jgi:hypothetical protein
VNLLGRGRFSGACSPESESPQQPIEGGQGGDVDYRRSKGHRCADGGIKHPGGQDDRHARFGLNDRDLSLRPSFGVELPDLTAMQRMPAVMDCHILVDMGRMNPRWLSGAATGPLPDPTRVVNAPRRSIALLRPRSCMAVSVRSATRLFSLIVSLRRRDVDRASV